jgi:CheY-like chemotaxis protein
VNPVARLPSRDPGDTSGHGRKSSDERASMLPYSVAVALPATSLLAILFYAWGDWDVLAVSALVAGSAFVFGGFLGFLFGIPRSLAAPEGADERETFGPYRPNTNLEQISDWLTKILVGVGLVQFTTLARHAGDLVQFLGPPLGDDSLGETFAGALLVIFGVTGFLTFYLVTRIYLPREFAQADRRARDLVGYRRVRNQSALEDLLRTAVMRTGETPKDDRQIKETVARAAEISDARGAPQILWVDDEPEHNVNERSVMATLGMQVTTCLSSEEALELLGRASFDVLISDMGRPGDSQAGYTLLEEMRVADITTPFIIYSSSNKPEHKELARQRGALGSTNSPTELLDLVVEAVRVPKQV